MIKARIVRYGELKPCFNAFIDTRSPGSEAKENFTIIGPGVSENPDQHVHIAEPHGFNIGGARQPPRCVNSQHSHDTAEVFVVHSGQWRFDIGEHGDVAQVRCGPGDLISLPTSMFRGFTNVGEETGFLWAVLGGDDPGRVLWAPQVFDMAADYGLILLENGSLVDTATGQSPPPDDRPMPRTTAEQIEALRRPTAQQVEGFVVRNQARIGAPQVLIGEESALSWPHGFELVRHDLARGETLPERPARDRAEVLFVHRGAISIDADDGPVMLGEGDTVSVPADCASRISASGTATLFAVCAV